VAAEVAAESVSGRPTLSRRLSVFLASVVATVSLLIIASVGIYGFINAFMAGRNDEAVRSENRSGSPLNPDGSLALPHLIYDLKDDFRTNLADEGRLVMVKFFLSYGTTEPQYRSYFEEVVASEIGGRETEIRDVITTVLSSKTAAQMESYQGRIELKRELVSRINGILSNGKIEDVYYGYLVVL
jgi:flagellar FliL protein